MKGIMIGVAISFATIGCVNAKPMRCAVTVVRDVKSDPTSSYVMKKGSADFTFVTQVQIDKKTGKMTFCSHGTSCYPADAFELVGPCRFVPGERDEEYTFFDAK